MSNSYKEQNSQSIGWRKESFLYSQQMTRRQQIAKMEEYKRWKGQNRVSPDIGIKITKHRRICRNETILILYIE